MFNSFIRHGTANTERLLFAARMMAASNPAPGTPKVAVGHHGESWQHGQAACPQDDPQVEVGQRMAAPLRANKRVSSSKMTPDTPDNIVVLSDVAATVVKSTDR
jgi:hypothetical protein